MHFFTALLSFMVKNAAPNRSGNLST